MAQGQERSVENLTCAKATGYAVSGGFKNALSSLRTAGVIIGKNTELMRHVDELIR